jgi:hypothetical protein
MHTRRPWTEKQDEQLRALWELQPTISRSMIARALGRRFNSVWTRAGVLGLRHDASRPLQHKTGVPEVDAVINAAAAVSGIAADELIGPSRQAEIVKWRYATMYAARLRAGPHKEMLAQCFKRDRSTVDYGLEQARQRIERDDGEMQQAVERLLREVDRASSVL